jgi:hypothetical protein
LLFLTYLIGQRRPAQVQGVGEEALPLDGRSYNTAMVVDSEGVDSVAILCLFGHGVHLPIVHHLLLDSQSFCAWPGDGQGIETMIQVQSHPQGALYPVGKR